MYLIKPVRKPALFWTPAASRRHPPPLCATPTCRCRPRSAPARLMTMEVAATLAVVRASRPQLRWVRHGTAPLPLPPPPAPCPPACPPACLLLSPLTLHHQAGRRMTNWPSRCMHSCWQKGTSWWRRVQRPRMRTQVRLGASAHQLRQAAGGAKRRRQCCSTPA